MLKYFKYFLINYFFKIIYLENNFDKARKNRKIILTYSKSPCEILLLKIYLYKAIKYRKIFLLF